MKKAPLGTGERFAAVMESAKASGARNPAAVAASVGIKKYGKKKMAKLAQAGKKRKAKGKKKAPKKVAMKKVETRYKI